LFEIWPVLKLGEFPEFDFSSYCVMAVVDHSIDDSRDGEDSSNDRTKRREESSEALFLLEDMDLDR